MSIAETIFGCLKLASKARYKRNQIMILILARGGLLDTNDAVNAFKVERRNKRLERICAE